MSNKDTRSFQDEIQRKLRNLLTEFGEGKISSEQFNILYERYNNQLEMALQLLDHDTARAGGNEASTIAIRKATAGKAVGLALYHHRSGTIIETLGNFDLSAEAIAPTLNEFSKKLEERAFIEPVTRKLNSGIWVIFMARHFTTAIVLFKNEPAPAQIRELERLLHDFEEANHNYLDQMSVEREKLAKPFIGFVRKKLNR
ncbi:MAG: hypothetical protein ACFE0Q_13140 [Anaerolineae bacterium]